MVVVSGPNNWILGYFRPGLNLGSGLGPVMTGDWRLGLGLDNLEERDVIKSSATDLDLMENKKLECAHHISMTELIM